MSKIRREDTSGHTTRGDERGFRGKCTPAALSGDSSNTLLCNVLMGTENQAASEQKPVSKCDVDPSHRSGR